ncbi:MAG: 4Fe-4S binding protein [Actinomycetota bacterium]|nr:4Fe-4S binding protein [Actinomycetota bacterium]MDD5665703.1 4Fe-4S binding protein [Actinomycetota bacterium]
MVSRTARRKEGPIARLLFMPLLLVMLQRTVTLHWGDPLIGEKSPLRLFMLKRYAWIEVRFLRVLYWVLNLRDRYPVFGKPLARKLSYLLAGKFVGERMVAGQVMTLEEMLAFIDDLPEDSRVAVGPCRCRLATHACDHPMETDIVIMTGTQIWLDLFPGDYRVISREEAKEKVRECYELALVPMLDRHMYYRGSANYFVICNCCGCSCLPINGYIYYKGTGFKFIPSVYRSVVDVGKCEGCGKCVEVCAFEERRLRDGHAQVLDCQGCGQCVRVCPNQANSMVKR